MQISSRIVLACVITTMVSPTFLRAADTEAQIKARQALEQKMQELQTRSGTQAPAEQPIAPMTKPAAPAAAKPMYQPAPAAPAVVSKPKPSNAPVFQSAPQASSTDIEKAREALRKAMQELQSRPEPEATAEAPKAKEPTKAANKKEPVFENTPAVATAAPAPVKKDEPKKVKEKQPEKTVAAAKSPMTLQPLQGPPTGLSADQEQQLQDLLQQYREDKLTPDEYHTARMKVLGR
ncbi:MAG: hypothetical protein ACTHLW_00520 [Verrucomicrobiota bacterium]